jgi:hypothetical protein
MRDQDQPDVRVVFGAIDAFGHDAQRVDVKAGVSFVEHRELGASRSSSCRIFGTFLLAAGEALVHRTLEAKEGSMRSRRRWPRAALCSKSRIFGALPSISVFAVAQEVGHRHAGHLDRVLHGQEQPGVRALVGSHFEQILPIERSAWP